MKMLDTKRSPTASKPLLSMEKLGDKQISERKMEREKIPRQADSRLKEAALLEQLILEIRSQTASGRCFDVVKRKESVVIRFQSHFCCKLSQITMNVPYSG